MYVFLNTLPQTKDIRQFEMHQSINENYINYRVNYSDFSREEKEQFIKKYKINKKNIKYNEQIFLSIPVTNINQNTSAKEK